PQPGWDGAFRAVCFVARLANGACHWRRLASRIPSRKAAVATVRDLFRGSLRYDIEGEVALGDVRIDRQHAPRHAIRSGRKLRHRDAQQCGLRTIDLRITFVDLSATAVHDAHGAERGFELLREPQLYLRGRSADRA